MLNIGFVGFGNHAAKLRKCLQVSLGSFDVVSYHPTKQGSQITNNFDDLCVCDVVFITSPNETHFKYIKHLLDKTNAKIFCEKPPCSNNLELNELMHLNPQSKGRIFFNFNYRYSNLCKFIQSSITEGLIGNVMHVHGIISHGLAFKVGYQETWRGNYPKNESVVLDTSLIHLIDLCNYCFNGPLKNNFSLAASFKHELDSFAICLESRDNVHISLYGSYAAPYNFSLMVLGTNGFIEANDTVLVVKHPRDTFNEEGFFIAPPIHSCEDYSFEIDYQNSLQSSVNYFISQAKSGESFSNADFDLSLATTRIVFDAQLDHGHRR